MRSATRFLIIIAILFFSRAMAQVSVTFLVDSSAIDKDSSYFLAGNINGWKPADSAYRFKNGKLIINAKEGDVIEYKITGGSWETVETGTKGADIANRVLKISSDTVVNIRIAGWKNNFGVVAKKHTASPNVMILDTAFAIPQLARHRTIRIYLPPGYKSGGKKYPVLYMSDGQNCFDEFTGSFGEWHVDETLDHFYDSCKKSMIVVAVDHGDDHRLQEYDPYDFEKFGKGEGKAYTRFLVETLKPYIDKHFRTLGNKKHTHIAGSSMGGVISMWAIIAYPEVFGNAGIFSPAFWTAMPIYNDTEKKIKDLTQQSFFFYAGGNESKTMVADTKKMFRVLNADKRIRAQLYVDELAQHNEASWSKWFPVYLRYILR
jgi:predicted alpha/beta superfamily hydrolase